MRSHPKKEEKKDKKRWTLLVIETEPLGPEIVENHSKRLRVPVNEYL